MTLAALIRKNGLGRIATATPATVATEVPQKPESVAKVATVAVAGPPTNNPKRDTSPVVIDDLVGPSQKERRKLRGKPRVIPVGNGWGSSHGI